jgi:hypothetical protein
VKRRTLDRQRTASELTRMLPLLRMQSMKISLCDRRRFLQASAMFVAPLLRPGWVKASGSSATAEVLSINEISPQPEYYCGWPTLARQKSGRLMLVWSGRREGHICPFGTVEWMTSDDQGKSWTWPRTLLDSAIDDRDAGVLETSRGTILVTTFTSLAYEPTLKKAEQSGKWPPERLQHWQAAHRRLTAAERTADLGTWVLRSTDGGRTWSTRQDSLVNSPHGPIQLADGRILYAGKELWKQPRRNGISISNDDGQTWEWLAEIPTRPGDDAAQYHELHAVEAANGRIIVHLRNQNRTNDRETLQTESSDGGKTWSVPRSIGVWGLPSHLMRLQDGRLLMSYGYRREPFGNQARLSADNGESWSAPITISDDAASGDLGYPSTVQLDDGSLLTAWYELRTGSPRAVLRLAHWRLTA